MPTRSLAAKVFSIQFIKIDANTTKCFTCVDQKAILLPSEDKLGLSKTNFDYIYLP